MLPRRKVLALGAVAAAGSVAGCTGETDDETGAADGDEDGTETADAASEEHGAAAGRPELGVAAEWTAIRARVADALALGVAEEFSIGAAAVGDTLARFEAATDEWGVHEQLEETDREAYEEFEEALEELRLDGLEEGDLDRARTEIDIADEQLRRAKRDRLAARNAAAFDMGLFGARVADVATLATAGAFDAAETLAEVTDEDWEDADVHDALGTADPDLYAAFEGELPGLVDAAADEDSEGVRAAADAALTAAFDAVYALADDEAAGDAAQLSILQARGWDAAALGDLEGVAPETAADVMRDTFGRFESARSHEALETADRGTYEAFEGELEAYADALAADEGVEEAAADFAATAQRAQFAVADALKQAPGEGGDHGHGDGHDHDDHDDLEGDPNVVDEVPDDADHVIELHAASFEPAELAVEAGETVAFEHVEGEPHTVTAYEDAVPAAADYWASGDFDSESAAREGWGDGRGALFEGQAYVRTFDVAGTHEFCCLPHEAAGQTGRLIVE